MNDFLRIDASLAHAAEALQGVSESPRLDAELLLARALNVPRSFLYAHGEAEIDGTASDCFLSTIEKRADGVPLAYITGKKEFWSMNLIVTPAALIPRPETEILVEQTLRRIPKTAKLKLLDLGTGTGAIALALAKERPLIEVVATDVSNEALTIGKVNARRLQIANIEFLCGDWLKPVQGRCFNLIATNPPYVADEDPLFEKLRHEPRLALAGGADGLAAIRTISRQAAGVLDPEGFLIFEHGATQADEIARFLTIDGWREVELVKDLAGHPRVTIALRPAH